LSTRYFRDRKMSFRAKTPAYRLALVFPCVVLALAGCASSVHPEIPEISVHPSSVVVAEGSITTFTAVFSPGRPKDSSLTWGVSPANGGTINSKGVYTASQTPGHYTIVAIWTSDSAAVGPVSASASVEVLPPPQADAVINPDMAQGSGVTQSNSAVRNQVIVGQSLPLVISADPTGNIQSGSGFMPPIPCTDCDVVF
jgi:hypothetical protein